MSTGEREVTLVDATRGFCSDAWHGRRPALAHFTVDLAADVDETRDALAPGRWRAA